MVMATQRRRYTFSSTLLLNVAAILYRHNPSDFYMVMAA
jgi:hypothetical protein